MKKAAVHARAVEQPHGSGIAVREYRFGAVLGCDGFEAVGDFIQRLIPGNGG